MKRISIKLWLEKIRLVAIRFPFSILYLLGLSYLFLSQINHWIPEDIKPFYWALSSLGIPMSIALSLYAEQFLNKYSRLAFQFGGLILLAVFCYFLPDKFVPAFTYQLFAIGLVMTLSILFVSYLKKNNDINFWEFSKTTIIQLVIAYVFALVLFAGLSLAILSLKELFNIDIQSKVYANLSVICYVIFAPIYFLANIPDEIDKFKNEYTFHTILKILGSYILLPILAIYSLILYVYLARIIFQWELPNGWVSTLVTVLSLGGFTTMLILYPMHLEGKSKVVNVFFRYFSLLLFPLLVLMLIGIVRRFSDYGITINRGYILLLNLWLFGICHYLFYSKAKHLKWIVISFSAVLFLTSVGPWRVTNLTKNMLSNQLEDLFVKEDMLKDGKVVPYLKQTIDSVDNAKMVDIIYYLNKNYGTSAISKFFPNSIENKSVNQLVRELNLKSVKKGTEISYISANLLPGYMIPVDNYKYMIEYHFNNSNGLNFKNDRYSLSLKNNDVILNELISGNSDIIIALNSWLNKFELSDRKNKNNHLTVDEMTIESDSCRLIILNISATYNPELSNYKIDDLGVQLFLKD